MGKFRGRVSRFLRLSEPYLCFIFKFNGISYVAVASYKYCVERMSKEEVTAWVNENVTYHPEIVREEMLL